MRPSVTEVVDLLRQTVTEPRRSAIISFEGFLDHWTVVTSVTETSIELFDSCSLRRVQIANLRMSYEPPKQRHRQHVVSRSAVFVVKPKRFPP